MKGPQKDPFDWLQDSESPLFFGVGVIINSAVNPEVSLVSRCQARLCPEGVICSRSSAPLPICLERKNNGFSITLYSSSSHTSSLSLSHYHCFISFLHWVCHIFSTLADNKSTQKLAANYFCHFYFCTRGTGKTTLLINSGVRWTIKEKKICVSISFYTFTQHGVCHRKCKSSRSDSGAVIGRKDHCTNISSISTLVWICVLADFVRQSLSPVQSLLSAKYRKCQVILSQAEMCYYVPSWTASHQPILNPLRLQMIWKQKTPRLKLCEILRLQE